MAAQDFLSLPALAAGASPASAASAWGYGSYVEIVSASANTTGIILYGLSFQVTNTPALDTTHQLILDIATGAAASEVVKVQVPYSFRNDTQVGYYITDTGQVFFPEPYVVPAGVRVAVRAADTLTSAITYNEVRLRYRQPNPAFTQAEAAFYEDGTESGATVISAGADSITRDLSGGDSNIALRIRLQETNGETGATSDDYKLQASVNSGSYLTVGIDEALSTSNTDGSTGDYLFGYNFSGSNRTAIGQSFDGDGNILTKLVVGLKTSATPPASDIFAELYAHTGTYGSSGIPTGSPLDTSNTVAVGTFNSSTYTNADFVFSGGYTLTSGTKYVVVIKPVTPTTTSFDAYLIEHKNSGSYPGNLSSADGTPWAADSFRDIKFYLYTQVASSTAVIPFASASLTDGGATTNRLGSGTGSFVAGEVSEDGTVDDLGITASNYTELLYSLTIDSASVADTDTIDFRVLRNNAAIDTYTVTPRITVSIAAGNYSGTPGIATLTLAAQTPTVAATNNKAITFASPSALAVTAQTPTSKLDNRITPGIATLTLTAQTPTVTATNNVAITLASPTALTLTAQTPTSALTDNKAITFAAPTAIAITPQTPTSTVSYTVTPGILALTTAPQTPTVVATDNKIITFAAPIALVTTPQTPSVVGTNNKAITFASPTALALSPQTPTASLTANQTVIPGLATLTTTAHVIGVAVSNNQAVTPGTGSLTTTLLTPTVSFTANQAITTASPTSITITPNTPSVAATANQAVTLAAPTALVTANQTPTVAFTDNKTATPGIATLTLTAWSPTVAFTANQAVTTASPTALTTSPQTPTAAVSDNKSVTFLAASLTTNRFTPTVAATDNKAITLQTASLTLAAFAITAAVSDNKFVALNLSTLTTTAYAPTVAFTDNKAITLQTASLVISTFSIGVAVSNSSALTPGTGTLTITAQTPSVAFTANVVVTPGPASLSLSANTPTVAFTANQSITLQIASLTITPRVPTVAFTANQAITLQTASLATSLFAPTVATDSGPVAVTPGVATLVLAMFAPTVAAGSNVNLTPGRASLSISTSYPIVNGQVRQRDFYIDSNVNVYWVVNETIGLVEKV